MPPKAAVAAKKQPLNLAQLSSYDDLLTDALIDHVSFALRPTGATPPAL